MKSVGNLTRISVSRRIIRRAKLVFIKFGNFWHLFTGRNNYSTQSPIKQGIAGITLSFLWLVLNLILKALVSGNDVGAYLGLGGYPGIIKTPSPRVSCHPILFLLKY